jgi:hypothetical protein
MITIGRFNRSLVGVWLMGAILSGCAGQQGQSSVPPAAQPGAQSQPQPAKIGKAAGASTEWTVSGRNVELDGKPFFIKGVDYGNTQIDAYADSNPLDDKNEAIWQPDLDQMRAAGVNAVKVYNVTLRSFDPYEPIIGGFNKLKPYENGKIDKFLKAAWNNGNKPIYVVLSVFFGGANINEPRYVDALNAVYKLMAMQYGNDPAVMGVSIGSEINSEEFINQPSWWKGLNQIVKSTNDGFKTAGGQKITTTTMVDDGLRTVKAGELAGFKVDTWGLDVYRGRSIESIFSEIPNATGKPVIIAEYGASAGYYAASTAKYNDVTGACNNYPEGTGKAPYYGLPPPAPWEKIAELPQSGNPRMPFLDTYVGRNTSEIYEHRATDGGVTSGGFYFEWNDEWWKSGWPFKHIGGFEGNKIIKNVDFPGCYDDQAWFGLNGESKTGNGDKPFPDRTADKRVPRPTLSTISALYLKEE